MGCYWDGGDVRGFDEGADWTSVLDEAYESGGDDVVCSGHVEGDNV